MIFRDSQGKAVSLVDIAGMITKDFEHEVFVGTDSQVHRKKKCVIYATCIVLYRKGKGGRVFVAKENRPYANSLKERLMNEVWRSLEVSWELSQILPKNVDVTVHVDVNKSMKYKSGNYHQELVSLVTGQGFKCRIKPYAWAAQSIADHFTKK
jgi:predicted RNase H-related nuclease YkuK (DUF458 family)